MRSPVRNSEDLEQLKRAADRADPNADMAWVASDPRGRRVLWRILTECGPPPSVPSHVPGDPYSTAFNDGARAPQRVLFAELMDAHPNLYIAMLAENHVKIRGDDHA